MCGAICAVLWVTVVSAPGAGPRASEPLPLRQGLQLHCQAPAWPRCSFNFISHFSTTPPLLNSNPNSNLTYLQPKARSNSCCQLRRCCRSRPWTRRASRFPLINSTNTPSALTRLVRAITYCFTRSVNGFSPCSYLSYYYALLKERHNFWKKKPLLPMFCHFEP